MYPQKDYYFTKREWNRMVGYGSLEDKRSINRLTPTIVDGIGVDILDGSAILPNSTKKVLND